jgi:hypothetical protein
MRKRIIIASFNYDYYDIIMETFLKFENADNYRKIANYTSYKSTSNVSDVYDFIHNKLVNTYNTQIKWIPYIQINNLVKIAEGGYGIIYSATLLGKTVAIKRLSNSQVISTHFLNEVSTFIQY